MNMMESCVIKYHFPEVLIIYFLIFLCGSRGIYKLAQCSEHWYMKVEEHFLKLNNPNTTSLYGCGSRYNVKSVFLYTITWV